METSTFILLSLVVCVSAFVQGAVGVGFALIVAPIFSIVQPELVPVTLLVIMLPLNFYVWWRERHALDLPGLGWITLGRTVGGFFGAAILLWISTRSLNIFIGVSTILAAVASLAAPSFRPGLKSLLGAGFITGVTETATGIGGPPLALVYQHHPAAALRSTIAACFFVGEVISLVMLAVGGQISASLLLQSVYLIPAVIVGVAVSCAVHHRIGGAGLRAGVMIFAIAAGLFLTVREFA
ncbi:MAG: sulfite exporter TauE/SafE family protein [Planctomycetes bacterium]|nr:sulfite exporter TauE/SafE family protein [Planctomycetota bacterium]